MSDKEPKDKVIIEKKAKKQLENEHKATKNNKQKVNKVLLTVVLVLAIIVIIIGIVYGGKILNKAKLDNEINELSSKSIENDDFSNINIQTSGQYAIVEKAIKEFYNEYSTLRKEFIDKINDEKIQKMLSIENYQNDGPEFQESLQYIQQNQEEFGKIAENLENILKQESIMERVENQDLSSYYINLYRDYFFEGDNLIEDLQKSYQDVIDAKKLMNNLYNNETKILNFLIEHKESWTILDNKLTFDTASLSAEYKTLKTQLYAE